MKKYSWLFASLMVIALAFTFTSCEDEDDKSSVINVPLSGKWYISETGILNPQGVVVYEDYPNTDGCSKDYVDFSENGTFATANFTGVNCDIAATEATWARADYDLTFVSGTGDEQVTTTKRIFSLYPTELRLSYVDEGVTKFTVYTRE